MANPDAECIAVCCTKRWAAVVPGEVDVDAVDLPSPEEARAAVLARGADGEGASASATET
jgi:hypothetical protein